jgi:hypothetical protein
MILARRCEAKGARLRRRVARPALFATLVLGVASACAASGVNADTRFGDSTWVAPASPAGSDSTANGPRVAVRDHERGWETVLRAPFRVVFFPLRLLGNGLEAGAGFLGPRFLDPKPKVAPKPGPGLKPNISISAINDIGIGPAVTWVGFPTEDARMRLAGTWSAIDRRRVRFTETIGDRRPMALRVRGDYDYRPNRSYFGIGNETSQSNQSYYLLESSSADATMLLGASPLRQLRFGGGFTSMTPRSGYHATPLLEAVFDPASVPFNHLTTQELWFGVAADVATIDEGRDPSRGVHGRVDLRRAEGIRSGDPGYTQWQLEGRAYLPVFAKRRVIAVRGVYAGLDPSGGNSVALPFYRLEESDGATRFAGYASERFRDRQLMLARIEYRWQFLYRMSAIGLYEMGQVAPRLGSFSLGDMHKGYGGGLRLGLTDETAIRFEVAKGDGGLETTLSWGSGF